MITAARLRRTLVPAALLAALVVSASEIRPAVRPWQIEREIT
jgi:hypothetical protein